jgi:hypothetical protein
MHHARAWQTLWWWGVLSLLVPSAPALPSSVPLMPPSRARPAGSAAAADQRMLGSTRLASSTQQRDTHPASPPSRRLLQTIYGLPGRGVAYGGADIFDASLKRVFLGSTATANLSQQLAGVNDAHVAVAETSRTPLGGATALSNNGLLAGAGQSSSGNTWVAAPARKGCQAARLRAQPPRPGLLVLMSGCWEGGCVQGVHQQAGRHGGDCLRGAGAGSAHHRADESR